MRNTAIAATLTLLLNACGHIPVPYQSYDGPPRPQTEIATIYADWLAGFHAGYALVIKSVDGKSVGMTLNPLDPRNMLVSVTPGTHNLGISLSKTRGIGGGLLEVEEWKVSLPIDARPDGLYSVCMRGTGRPEVELREVGATSTKITSQEEWNKYITKPCP